MNKIITLIALLLLMATSCEDCPESPEYIFVQACDDISDMPQPQADDEILVRVTSLLPNPQEGKQEMVIRNFSTDTFDLYTLSLKDMAIGSYYEGLTNASNTIDSSSVLNPCDSIRITLDNYQLDTLGNGLSGYELYYQHQINDAIGVIQFIQYRDAKKGEEIYF